MEGRSKSFKWAHCARTNAMDVPEAFSSVCPSFAQSAEKVSQQLDIVLAETMLIGYHMLHMTRFSKSQCHGLLPI